MGTIHDKECYLTVIIGDKRWTYKNNGKPTRKMIFKNDGEWLGWVKVGTPVKVEIRHGFRQNLFVRDRVWVKKDKWEQRGDNICPEISEYCIHRTGWSTTETGSYKMKIEIYNGKESIMTKVITLKVCKA